MASDSAQRISSPRSYYEDQLRSHSAVAEQLSATKRLISRSRSGVVAVWLVLLVLGINAYIASSLAWALAAIAFLGLLILVAVDERLLDRIKLKNEQADIARIQLARLDRTWKEIPEFDVEVPSSVSSVSYDLDLFGHASLYQLLCRAHTPRGIGLLRDWLVEPATPEVVRQRNLAAAKLAPMREYREKLDLRGRILRASVAGPKAFVEWAESEPWLEKRGWLKWSTRLLVVSGALAFTLGVLGLLPETAAVTFCMAVAGANLLISVVLTGKVHDIFEKVDSRQHDVLHYRELLELFDSLPNDPELLASLRHQMGSDTSKSRAALTWLARIMKVAQMRHSPLFGVFHLILQLVFLIDFHVLGVLEQWQRKHGGKVRAWFDAIGELEALASLASLVHDHPDWTFPTIDSESTNLRATSLGHPLLASPVCNDVAIGPCGTFLLVTGSNMSGKSTLLRTIGVNTVLAQAGGPVHASAMSLPPIALATSMRIQDSLEDGISFFMAELQRLKEVVDHAEGPETEGRIQLFLLDEILQGTNSAERHIAVAKVVSRLTDSGAMGAISTHDLELASKPELTATCKTVHFKESFTEDGRMTFDYRMREGVATTTNALKLLELVGIRDKATAAK